MSEKKGCLHCCFGCFIALLFAILLALGVIALTFWLLMHYAPKDGYLGAAGRHCNALAFEYSAKRAVTELPISEDEKKLLSPVISELKNDLRKGTLERGDLKDFGAGLVSSPLPWALLLLSFHAHYVADNPAFTAEEKASAKISTRRLAKGLIDGKVEVLRLSELLLPISSHAQNTLTAAAIRELFEKGALKEALTPELSTELIKEKVKAIRGIAKNAQIPVTDTEINLAPLLESELKKLREKKLSPEKTD